MPDARAAADDFFRVLPSGGKVFALCLSVFAHGAVVLAVAHGARRAAAQASPPRDALVEIAALDLDMAGAAPVPAPSQDASVARPHTHPYPVPPGHDTTPHDPTLYHQQATVADGDPMFAAAPAVLDAPPAPAPRFLMTVGSASRAAAEVSAPGGQAASPGSSAANGPVPEASVDTAAKLLAGNSAIYTPEAEAAGVEADVPLEIVVGATGVVVGARALAHVGYGLDEAALRSVRAYRFSPALRGGRALAVRMRWIMRFQLR